MHLKSVRVQGFKTFARRTDLPFGRGITAIVGPNGSGKSNLVDAIRWALGERNARGLRGHRMEDVIYAGGPGKSAVGMAEVTLLIDNADQRLNVEFNEIEVARRLYRSGESEYLVNGIRSRLKDIDALLASTGLRQDGYAVTAQNDIDFVIQAPPAVRRELIEEAAGVRRLRDQRQEAVTRLGEAERDMSRARDLLAELSPRADELRAQAAAAQDYQKVQEQLKELQGSLARDAWRKAMVLLRRARAKEHSAQQKQTAARAGLAEFEPRYGEHREALLRAHEARWNHQQALADCRLRLADGDHQVRIADERSQAVAQALAAARREMDRLAESERAGGQVVVELERSVAALWSNLETVRLDAAAAEEEEDRCQRAQAVMEEQRAALLQRHEGKHRERLSAQAEIRQLEDRLQFLKEQRRQSLDEFQEWSQRASALDTELTREAQALRAAEEGLLARAASATDLERRLDALTQALSHAEQSAAAAAAAWRAREAEAAALRLLRDHAERQSPLANNDLGMQRLVEVLEVDPGFRPAVEAVLESVLQGWVAGDPRTAEQAVERIRSDVAGRETILFNPAIRRDGGVPSPLRSLRAVIGAPAYLDPLLGQLLDGVVLVDTLAEARQVVRDYPGLQAVTMQGDLLAAWSYRGGRSERATLQAQAQVRDAEAELAAAAGAHDAARTELEERTAAHAWLAAERAKAMAALEAARSEHTELAGRVTATRAAAARDAELGRRLDAQIARITAVLEQSLRAHHEALARQEQAVQTDATVQAQVPVADASLRAAHQDLATAARRRQEAELQAALAQQRHDDLVRQLARAREVWQPDLDELAQQAAAVAVQEAQPAQLAEERIAITARVESTRLELEALSSARLPDAGSLNTMDTQVREDEQRNVTLQVECAHADDAVAAALTEVEAAQSEVDRCALTLREDPLAFDEQDGSAEVDWQKTERDVSRLQRRLDAMGAVNLLAPDEYAQVNDRCQSLASQLQDLEAACGQLVELRKRLEHEIDERFRTVFQSVAVNFQEFFGELFPGGRATLRLEDDVEDPLDEGVEILAQTPGKRLQPLTLLSGGERALTALAFLFALQAVNPSPFYVLDEVDAALDDTNVLRFNRVLTRLAREQQFLVVTHNHSTMAQAEVLYGVTLGEHGISRIVSVRLERETAAPRLSERTA